MKSKPKTDHTVHNYQVLNSMTRDELRGVATSLGIPIGKEKKNTVANIVRGIIDGKVQLKTMFYIFAPATTTAPRRALFVKKLRTYKDDKVIQPAPVVVK